MVIAIFRKGSQLTLKLLILAATNVSDFCDFEKIANILKVLAKMSCVPEYVISSDKFSIKILKIAEISCR